MTTTQQEIRAKAKGWRFAFSSRWFGYLAMTIAFAIACVALSMWQIDRRDQAVHQIELVQLNYDRTPVPLAQAIPARSDYRPAQQWTPVIMTGQYLVEEQLLVRNRPFNGQSGFEVLTPLRLGDGSVFIVDRGWLPSGTNQDLPDQVPAPPTGEVTVTARLMSGEPTLPNRTTFPASGQIATIQLHEIAKRLAVPTYTAAYGLMDTENPAADETRPAARPKPQPDEGPHLSYAFQWIVFGVLAFLGLGWAVRQEYRIINAEDPEEKERVRAREKRRAARGPSDDEAEDALIENAANH